MEEQLNQVDLLLKAREIKKAEVAVARMLRADPAPEFRAELLLRRARARLIGQHPDDALEDIQTARALVPAFDRDPRVLELLADTYFARFELSPVGFVDRVDAERALKLYDEILEQSPAYANTGWVLYQKARVHLSADRVDEAVKCLQAALVQPSENTALTALCYERLGFIHLFDRRDAAGALAFLDRAAVTYPPAESVSWLGQLHILRSRALREQRKYNEALAAARQALQIMESLGSEMRSGQQDAHLAIGEILAQIPGEEDSAVDHLHEFLQLGKKPLGVDVTWSRVNELLGDMLFRVGRFGEAVEAYNNALAYNPYHPWEAAVYYQVARSYYHMRAYEKTISTIEQIQRSAAEENETITDYRLFHLLGNAYFALEHYDRAVNAYQLAVNLAPAQAEDLEKIDTYLRFAQELSESR